MKNVILSAILGLASVFSYAGSQVGTIDYVGTRASDGLAFFSLKGGAKTGSPACAANNYWLIRDENSNTGKRQYATLLAAHMAGKTVTVTGLNTCARWPDGEDMDDVRIIN